MLKKNQLKNWINSWGPWRIAQAALGAAILLLACLILFQLVAPLRVNVRIQTVSQHGDSGDPNDAFGFFFQYEDSNTTVVQARQGLFKSEVPLRNTPRADATVEKLLSQLKLQCVLDIGGEPIAYIQIKGQGLKGCRLGDAIDDLFQVTHIDVDSQSVEILIADQKEILRL